MWALQADLNKWHQVQAQARSPSQNWSPGGDPAYKSYSLWRLIWRQDPHRRQHINNSDILQPGDKQIYNTKSEHEQKHFATSTTSCSTPHGDMQYLINSSKQKHKHIHATTSLGYTLAVIWNGRQLCYQWAPPVIVPGRQTPCSETSIDDKHSHLYIIIVCELIIQSFSVLFLKEY